VLHECFNLVNIKKIRPRLDKRLLLASKKLLAHFPIFSWHNSISGSKVINAKEACCKSMQNVKRAWNCGKQHVLVQTVPLFFYL